MEFYCRTQTTFGIKKEFLEKYLDSIEILIFGSSHNQNAINPEFLNRKTCNLAFGGQPISIDYYLLDKYIEKMSRLSTVFFEVTIFRFYDDLNSSAWNGHIYSNIYNINYKVESLSLKNYLLVYSDYQFFSKIFYDYCNPNSYKYKLNRFGFVTNDFNDRFEKLKYDTLEINKTFVMTHNFDNRLNFQINKEFYLNSIKKCLNKHIKVVLITPPLYGTYSKHIPVNAKKEIDSLIYSFVTKYGIQYFDYSCDNRFKVYDFKNDNHLNSSGAEKFSKIINNEILEKK